MDKMTLARRVLLHLHRYMHIDLTSQYEAPFEITQDGIGAAVGISRSHASLVLGRLERDGMVESVQATVSAGPTCTSVRKVYRITPKGLEGYGEAVRAAAEEGLDPELLVPRNINHCRTDAFDALARPERDVLGSLFLIAGPVDACTLPQGRRQPLVPLDSRGRVAIRDETRRRYTARASPEELRRWSSLAADWCAENGRPAGERIRHLAAAGRMREAARLAMDNAYAVMDGADRAVTDALDAVDEACRDGRLSAVVAFCYVRLGDPARARAAAARMDGSDPCLSGALEAEILLAEGKKAMALHEALECYCGDTATALALGKSMAENGRHSEAVVFLRRGRNSMRETGCLFRLDEALRWESESYMVLGKTELASKLMEIASYAAMDWALGERLRVRAEVMASQDRVRSECVHV